MTFLFLDVNLRQSVRQSFIPLGLFYKQSKYANLILLFAVDKVMFIRKGSHNQGFSYKMVDFIRPFSRSAK